MMKIPSKKLTIEWGTGDPELLKNSEQVYIASALVTHWSLKFVNDRVPDDVTIKMIIGIHLPSTPKALKEILQLQKEGRIDCRIYTSDFFHPKLYLFETSNAKHAYIGSGNFTKGGLMNNVELFHKTEDPSVFNNYKTWFENKFEEAIPFKEEHLKLLIPVFKEKRKRDKEGEQETESLADQINGKVNLEDINFIDQFFKKEHYEALKEEYQTKMDDEVLQMRKNVRHKLFELHDKLYPQFLSKWDLNPHYQEDHIVSSIDTHWHNGNKVSGMWLHYGRGKREIKRYGDDKSPVQFMRLQILLRKDSLGIWLCVGKDNGSAEDREYISNKLQENPKYLNELWDIASNLEGYTIRIGDSRKNIRKFSSPDKLKDFILNDDWRKHYFVIQKQFKPSDKAISEDSIDQTILSEFRKLYPLYRLFKDKSFE